jgi:hypothetical protein
MNTKPTYAQIADDFRLWGEYFDRSGNMSREEFDALDTGARIAMLVEAFGPESTKSVLLQQVRDAERWLAQDELEIALHHIDFLRRNIRRAMQLGHVGAHA